MTAPAFDFGRWACAGDRCTVERDGFTLTATLHADPDHDAPWDNEDGHGPVSGWRRGRDKQPGERVLSSDRGSYRFYDFAEAVKLARRDGWGTPGDEGLTPGAKAARAAEADFERLRAWCADDWYYVGVSVTVEREGVQLVSDYQCALWGVETDAPDYLGEVAEELAPEALNAARAQLAALCDCEG